MKKMRFTFTIKFLFGFLFLFSLTGLWAGSWNSPQKEVEVRLRIPMELLPRFKKLHEDLFKPLDYDWRLNPKMGHYYPYRNYYSIQPYDTNKYPVYFSDQYFNYYKEKVKSEYPPYPTEGKRFRPRIRREREIDFVKLGKILFKSGSSELNSTARQKLNIIAQKMMNNHFTYINIKGYADILGKSGKNYKLGLMRARKVAEYLESLGLDMHNTYIGSGGETTTEKKLKENRKAEIYGFYSALPYNKFTYAAQKLSYDKSGSNYAVVVLIAFIFIMLVGVTGYFVFTN